MYRLLTGLHAYLTQKEERSVIIIGLDNAGKSTLLEQVKHQYNPNTPRPDVSRIAPTVGQGVGKISLPSTILQFWDLGGQRDIRSIWPRYYSEAHAVVYVVDAADPVRLEEGWAVFEEVLAHPLTLNLPLLVLANKQDAPGALSGTDIRESYERWAQKKREGAAEEGKQVGEGGWLAQGRSGGTEALGDGGGSGGLLSPALEDGFPRGSTGGMEGRGGSLEVLGVSALEGDGVRAAIEWLFLRLQTSRRRPDDR